MRIGVHIWDPTLQSGGPSAAGLAATYAWILQSWDVAGHEILWYGDGSYEGTTKYIESSSKPDTTIRRSKPDVVFFPWRWPMPGYADRQAAYNRQNELIQQCVDENVPFFVHNQDHKIDNDHHAWLKSIGAHLTAPEVRPQPGYETLHYPNPYVWINNEPNNSTRIKSVVYVGNNYERYKLATRLLSSIDFVADFYGNWLVPSPYRESPDKVNADFPNAVFHERIAQDKVVETLSWYLATIHLAKDSYCRHGLIAIRWAEAAAAATPALIPYEFWLPRDLDIHPVLTITASNRIASSLKQLEDPRTFRLAVECQRQFVADTMRIEPWLEIVEKVAAHETA